MRIVRQSLLCILMVVLGYDIYAQTPEWVWAKRAGGINVDEGISLALDASGNSYITGNFIGTATFGSLSLTSNGTSYRDIFVAKMDAAGNWLWAIKAGGTNDERVSSIAVDSNGNAYITGYFNSSPFYFTTSLYLTRNGTSTNNDIFVAKVNTNGTWVWATKNSSGSQTDNGNAITLDSANNVYVTGSFYSTITFGTPVVASLTSTGYSDAFVAKLNTDGAWQWAVKADGATLDTGFGVTTDDSSNVFVCGCFNSTALTFGDLPALINTAGSNEIFVAKLSSGGVWSWARRAGGTGVDSASSIVSDGSAYLYLTGSFDSPSITFAAGISITRNGSSANNDIFVAKLDGDGNWSWARKAGGTGYDDGLNLDLDSSSNVYLTGRFTGPAAFGSTTLSSPEASTIDGFAAKLDASGNWQWAKRAGGAGTDNAKGIAVDSYSNAYVTGNYEGPVSFSGTTLSNAGLSDVFIAKVGTLVLNAPNGGETYTVGTTQNIQWNAPNVNSIYLDYSLNAGSSWNVITPTPLAANLGSYAWTVPDSTSNQILVRIRDSANASVYDVSDAVFSITTTSQIPAAPSNLTAVAASASQINLAWTDNSNNETGFKIERKTGVNGTWEQIATVNPNTSSYNNTGLTQNTIYYYRVKATNPAGDSYYSNEANATTPYTTPAAPTALSAVVISSVQINLAWTDNSSNETGFKIERKIGTTGTWVQIATVAANVVAYNNTGLTQNTTYYFRVCAYNVNVNSTYSNEASATTPYTTPAAPTGLAATTVSSSQINLAWVDNSTNESGFKIERKTGASGTWAQITTVGANVSTYSNNGLTQNTTYYYRVRAYNGTANSAYSNEANASTPYATPAAPGNLTATPVSSTQINLGWTDNSTNETGFKIERKTGATGTWAQIATVGANVNLYSNTGLTQGTTYFYRVRAYNVDVNSTYSNEASATPVVSPVANFQASLTAGYAPLAVQFTDSSTPGTGYIVSWAWQFGDGNTSTEQNPLYTYLVPGIYSVSLTVTNNYNGTTTLLRNNYISVFMVNPPVVDFSANQTVGYTPLQVQFSDTSTPGTGYNISWAWNFGDGNTSTAQNPVYTYQTAGIYSVSLTVTNSFNVSSTLVKPNYITAIQLDPPDASFTANITSGTIPLTVQFTDTSTPGMGYLVSWSWDFGDGGSSNEQHPLHIYQALGTYSVSLTVTNTYQLSDTLTISNYISVLPPSTNITLVTNPQMSFTDTYLGMVSDWQPIILLNSGNTELDILGMHFCSELSQFEHSFQFGALTALQPGERDTVFVRFVPTTVGAKSDTLFIQNNSENQPLCLIRLSGAAIASPPQAPQNLAISQSNRDVLLTWDPVTLNMLGQQLVPDYYFVYISGNPNEGYIFHGLTTSTQYAHPYALMVSPRMFYRIIAVKLYEGETRNSGGVQDMDSLLRSELKQGMTPEEVRKILDRVEKLF